MGIFFIREKDQQEWQEYLKDHTSDTLSEATDKSLANERATLAAAFDKMSAAQHAEMAVRSSYFSKIYPPLWSPPSPAASEAQSLQATEQASSAEPLGQHLLRRQPR